ncbi:DEAD-domain-containing protein [Rhizoclosmatium globosum]|uniref:ATP-dependent RNA helicase n=1 Tax=Rhizoclosmatium globosum TaxID=329046 RepID=A0A1Y2CEM4_9FUNG|nr:DEAD-domain-containing protein [Rhizoclosmatium globosum]|eukprot:ORY45499.1 DEAD-domain-containing protein [Rhizoclosmatium globosum]
MDEKKMAIYFQNKLRAKELAERTRQEFLKKLRKSSEEEEEVIEPYVPKGREPKSPVKRASISTKRREEQWLMYEKYISGIVDAVQEYENYWDMRVRDINVIPKHLIKPFTMEETVGMAWQMYSYLRSIGQPLFPEELGRMLLVIIETDWATQDKLFEIQKLFGKLPKEIFLVLKSMLTHLCRLSVSMKQDPHLFRPLSNIFAGIMFRLTARQNSIYNEEKYMEQHPSAIQWSDDSLNAEVDSNDKSGLGSRDLEDEEDQGLYDYSGEARVTPRSVITSKYSGTRASKMIEVENLWHGDGASTVGTSTKFEAPTIEESIAAVPGFKAEAVIRERTSSQYTDDEITFAEEEAFDTWVLKAMQDAANEYRKKKGLPPLEPTPPPASEAVDASASQQQEPQQLVAGLPVEPGITPDNTPTTPALPDQGEKITTYTQSTPIVPKVPEVATTINEMDSLLAILDTPMHTMFASETFYIDRLPMVRKKSDVEEEVVVPENKNADEPDMKSGRNVLVRCTLTAPPSNKTTKQPMETNTPLFRRPIPRTKRTPKPRPGQSWTPRPPKVALDLDPVHVEPARIDTDFDFDEPDNVATQITQKGKGNDDAEKKKRNRTRNKKNVGASWARRGLGSTRCYLCPVGRALKEVIGHEFLTMVQDKTIKEIIQGTDCLAQAKTGTGKTLGFLIPAIERLVRSTPSPSQLPHPNSVSILVISPTRELAQQIEVEAVQLLRFLPFKAQSKRLKSLDKRVDILIATPGRLKDHLQNSNLKQGCASLQFLIFDEADRLLDQGFKQDIDQIMAMLPPGSATGRQTLLFSATIPLLLPNYKFITTISEYESSTHEHVPQHSLVVPMPDLLTATYSLLLSIAATTPFPKIIIFFPTARTTQLFSELLLALNTPTLPPIHEIHSRKSQSARTKATDLFRASQKGIMVSSDVSARGMDFPGVTHVLQVGIPTSREQYVHRLGRTARAGTQGTGIILLAEFEAVFLKTHLGDLPIKPHPTPVSTLVTPLVKSQVEAAFTRVSAVTKSQAYQGWLGFYNAWCREFGWRQKEALVEVANRFAVECMGCDEVPGIPRQTVGKMGLKGVAGVVIDEERSGGGGGGRGGFGGRGGRGGGGGGGRGGSAIRRRESWR